ncbi:AEC family transporter [Paraburkholderia elongata]|nr:AEC family transporter [Paraburkholderia elongata]
MTSEIASALIPFLFSMGAGYFAGRIKKGAMPLSSINTMLVDYALPFALFLYTAKMQRASLAQHAVLIAVLVGVMLVPYFASLLVSRAVFKSDLAHAAVRAVTIGMPNFASVGLPLLRAVYGPESDLTVAIAVTAGAVVMSPAALILLERARPAAPASSKEFQGTDGLLAKALRNTFLKPVVLAPIAGVLASLCGWTLPDLLSQSLNIIGSTTAGLALFSTGLVLAAQPFKLDAQAGFGVLLSNVVQPLIALVLVSLLGVPKAIAGQAILLAAIPCGSFGILFGLSYGVSDASAGTTLVASSLLSAVTLSGTIVLLGHL